jgi:hypothetical protein
VLLVYAFNAGYATGCSHFVHVFCGSPAPGYDEGYGQKVLCSRCKKKTEAKGTVFLI